MNKSGFSLVQVLVFSAILSTVTLTLVALITYSSQMINYIEAKINQRSLTQAVDDQLQDAATCTTALGGQPFDPAATPTVYPANPSYLKLNLTVGAIPLNLFPLSGLYPNGPGNSDKTPNYGFDVVSLAFLNATKLGANNLPPAAPTDDVWNAELWVQLQIHKSTMGPQVLAPIKLTQIAIYHGISGAMKNKVDKCLPLNQYVMVTCAAAANPSIYLPSGFGTYAADANGCTDLRAFDNPKMGPQGIKGDDGDAGPAGSTGAPGAPGAKGARGAAGALIFTFPPGPAPKSDRRVKKDIREITPAQGAPFTDHETLRMQMILRLQQQQKALEGLRKTLGACPEGDHACAR